MRGMQSLRPILRRAELRTAVPDCRSTDLKNQEINRMPQAKQVSKRKRRSKAAPVLGAGGLLALASGVSAKTVVTTQTSNTGVELPIPFG
jgi:hypothetical protein